MALDAVLYRCLMYPRNANSEQEKLQEQE